MAMLAPDATWVADGGGEVSALDRCSVVPGWGHRRARPRRRTGTA
jgi:hypothetical protein